MARSEILDCQFELLTGPCKATLFSRSPLLLYFMKKQLKTRHCTVLAVWIVLPLAIVNPLRRHFFCEIDDFSIV